MKVEKPVVIRAGGIKLDDPNAVDFNIKNIIVHNGYSPTSKHNDIALVQIHGKFPITEHIAPACLHTLPDSQKNLMITGWGKTSIGKFLPTFSNLFLVN